MKIRELTGWLEQNAPLAYQEDYDNSGLLIGDPEEDITGVLVSLDVTEAVVDEAIRKGCNLIVAHHPLVFRGLKKLTGSNYVERTAIAAIRNHIGIYAIHTNLDHVASGVNQMIARRLGLENLAVLQPKKHTLCKLTVFVPTGKEVHNVLEAMHKAGAGHLGNYSDCSFRSEGIGSFTPQEDAQPAIGSHGVKEEVMESRLEVVFPKHRERAVLQAMRKAHPYEEVAYHLHVIENENQAVGAGAVGYLPQEMDQERFLRHLKSAMNLQVIRFTPCTKAIRRVAVCGGSGSFLLRSALAAGADAFVTADFKYHEFFDGEGQILIADIGHFESEVFTKELLVEIISKKITNFATCLSDVDTNPVNYFY